MYHGGGNLRVWETQIRLQITTHPHVWISTTTENQANPFVLQVTIASILERGVSNELASVLEWGVSGMF
jgi:hypothetical protein